jgi:uncharacterized protein with GYD domain
MAKFLVKARYTAPGGVQGVLSEGGSKRVEAVRAALESVGGSLESFYFAFGETDAFVIVDLPDNATAASLSLTVGATGTVAVTLVPLLTPEEVDRAAQMSPAYRAPGR